MCWTHEGVMRLLTGFYSLLIAPHPPHFIDFVVILNRITRESLLGG